MALSRFAFRDAPATTYAYLGVATSVIRAYPEPEVELTYINDTQTGDPYAGLDQYGRIVDHRWMKDGDDIEPINYYYNTSWRAVEEYRNTAPAPVCRYLWGLRSRWDLAKRERDHAGSLDEKRYTIYDAMDPVAICDEHGNVTQRFQHSPFGQVSFMDQDFSPGSDTDAWNWLFHGEFRDAATGYYNYGYRYYHDSTGRWPSRDPIGEDGGVNLYGFVANKPTAKIDIFGLTEWE